MNFLLKPKFLLWLVALLVLVNLATFVGIFFTHNNHQSMEKEREEYFQKLSLTPNQRQAFIDTREIYKKKNQTLYARYDSLMLDIRRRISTSPTDTAALFALNDSLGEINAQIRKNWTLYSLDVRNFLSESQKKKFDSLSIEHIKEKIRKKD